MFSNTEAESARLERTVKQTTTAYGLCKHKVSRLLLRSIALPIRLSSNLLSCRPRLRQRSMNQLRQPPDIKLHRNRAEPLLNQHGHHIDAHRTTVTQVSKKHLSSRRHAHSPKYRQSVLRRRSPKFPHRLYKSRIGLAAQSTLKVQAGIDEVVTGPEHQRVHAGYSGDFVRVLDALDRFNLRDDADVVVGCGYVVFIFGVQGGIVYARCESPGAEGAVAQRCCTT